MRDVGAEVKAAAVEVHNHIVMAGQSLKRLKAALDESRKDAFKSGGENAVLDFIQIAGSDRVDLDLVGLMISAGLERVLIASQGMGASRWKANPHFGERFIQMVDSGILDTHRGKPNADPLSAYTTAGQKVVANDQQ